MHFLWVVFALCLTNTLAFSQTLHTYTDVPASTTPIGATTPCSSPLIRTFTITDSYTISDLDVGIVIYHDWRGDIRMTLESPTGTRVTFANLSGGSAFDLNARFDDDASVAYAFDTADHDTFLTPYQFDRRPENALSAFDGEGVVGAWKLEICDNDVSVDDGTLLRAELFITDTVSGPVTLDGAENVDFPNNYWHASYYEGRDGVTGSATWGSASSGAGSPGSKTYHGEAYFGYGLTSTLIGSNGSSSYGRWDFDETPTDPAPHSSTYVGTSWNSNFNPYYQIDLRREAPFAGNLTFGSGALEIVDDVIEVFINGTREYAYFPSGGAPDPRPGGGVAATIPVAAGDDVLVRFINLGYIGGFTFQFDFVPNAVVLSAAKTVSMAEVSDLAIPGNDIIYSISVSNAGTSASDSDSIFLVDKLPPEVSFFNGDYNGAAVGVSVVGFADSSSGLSFDDNTDAAYSDAGTAPANFAACSYTPSAGYDVNVKYICFNPKGALLAGDPDPEFTLSFRAQIK